MSERGDYTILGEQVDHFFCLGQFRSQPHQPQMPAPSIDRLAHKVQVDRGSFRTNAFLTNPVQVGTLKMHSSYVSAVLRLANAFGCLAQDIERAFAVTGGTEKRWQHEGHAFARHTL